MSLNYLDAKTIGTALTCAWQKDLGTTKDPANGKWYTDGADSDSIGLYGGLSDTIPHQIQLDTSAAVYHPQQIIVDSAIVNNLNGLNPSSTVTLTYQYSTSIADTHSVTTAVALGAQFTIKVNEIVAEETTQFNMSFTFSSTDSTTHTTTSTDTFSQTVPVTVPSGKVFQVVLSAAKQQITVPYTVGISVTGLTETWFKDRVSGHYNWVADAGTAFGWINQYGCAGRDSSAYSNGGNGTGLVTLTGSVNQSQVANFSATIYDVTEKYASAGSAPALSRATALGVAPTSAPVVATIAF